MDPGFLLEFLRDPVRIGAVAPSGAQLARRMVTAAGLEPGHVVVELGAGTGAFTAAILAARPDGPFVALEPNPVLAARLRRRLPGVRVESRPAEEIREILAERALGPADRVISGLPFAIWSADRQRAVLDAVVAAMAPGGRLVTFGYLHSQLLPAAARLRGELAARFAQVTVASTAWWNLPPALVWSCTRPLSSSRSSSRSSSGDLSVGSSIGSPAPTPVISAVADRPPSGKFPR